MGKSKRAIALSGGGPPVGTQVGALKALDEFGIEFDVFSTDCIGSWTACIFNSHPPHKRIEKLEEFYKLCFVKDDIFEGFSVPVDIFVTDYFEELRLMLAKAADLSIYQDLFLPHRIYEYMQHYLNPANFPKSTVDLSLMWTKGLSLNPFCRLLFKLMYRTEKSGRSWLLGPGDHGADIVDNYIDFDRLMRIQERIYVNAYNLTQKRIDLFTNRLNPETCKTITLDALKANSSILGYLQNREIDGDKYCEGSVVDTVNFKHLKEHIHDLEEVWVLNILDYKTVRPPRNQLEADLLGVELPFTTIAHDDVKLFECYVKQNGYANKIKVVRIDMSYKDLDFFWKWSTLEKGIEIGYQGAVKTINDYFLNTPGRRTRGGRITTNRRTNKKKVAVAA